jgi:hypothetical protein
MLGPLSGSATFDLARIRERRRPGAALFGRALSSYASNIHS